MKSINVVIELYLYDDLVGKSKEKAFNEHEQFLRENPSQYEDKDGIMQYDDMDTWKTEDIKDYVEDSIRINKYLFYENGEIANVTHYTGKHAKSGKTELTFLNKVYNI